MFKMWESPLEKVFHDPPLHTLFLCSCYMFIGTSVLGQLVCTRLLKADGREDHSACTQLVNKNPIFGALLERRRGPQ